MPQNQPQNPYADLFSVAGKTAAITGGSSGLGLAMAEAYLRCGARVYITGRKPEPLEAARRELEAHGEVYAVQGDVATPEGVEALRAALAGQRGIILPEAPAGPGGTVYRQIRLAGRASIVPVLAISLGLLLPPAATAGPNANADVESVHHTIETEHFDAQVFSSKADFFAKTATYQLWYNAARKNSSRGYKNPADLLAAKAPIPSPPEYSCSSPSLWSLFCPP